MPAAGHGPASISMAAPVSSISMAPAQMTAIPHSSMMIAHQQAAPIVTTVGAPSIAPVSYAAAPASPHTMQQRQQHQQQFSVQQHEVKPQSQDLTVGCVIVEERQ